MPLPKKLQGTDKQTRLQYVLDRFLDRTHFTPGKDYNLLVQVKHDRSTRRRLKQSHPEFFTSPGNGLLRRDRKRVKTEPLRKIRFKSRLRSDFVPDHRTALEDLETAEDFKEWFAAKFSGLDDGVYTAIQRLGKGHGSCHLFVLRFEGGVVVEWKRKSNTQQNSGEGESSKYYGFPLYFYLRQRYDAV